MSLTDFLRGFSPSARARQAHRLATLIESNKALGRRVRGLEDALDGITRLVERVRQEHEQLAALHHGARESAAQLDALGAGPDAHAVAVHVRDAVDRGALAHDPCPHLVVPELLPPRLYDLLVATRPASVLLEPSEPGTRRAPAPPTLAPAASIVLWEFMVDEIVRPVLAPALAARLGIDLDLDTPLTACQFVWRDGRLDTPPVMHDAPARLTVILPLVRAGDPASAGPDVRPSTRSSQPALRLPWSANIALAIRHAAGAHTMTPPPEGPRSAEHYALEFQVH